LPAPRKQFITSEDLYRIQLLSEPRLSPDGRQIVYRLQRVDRKTEKKYSNLWVVAVAGGAPRQFTCGDQTDASPRWSPDGEAIAFLSNRGDPDRPAQIHLIPFQGGEARRLTILEGEILDFQWYPDGRRLLCSVRRTDPEVLERQKDEQKKKLGVVSRRYDRIFYKLDGYGYLPQQRSHLWSVETRTGRARQLTDHPVWDEWNPSISADGRTIAFVSNHSADPDLEEMEELFVMPASGGEARRVKAPEGSKWLPSFSPDGRLLAYYGVEGRGLGYSYKNIGLWIVPLNGSKPARNLTGNYDLHTAPEVINDCGSLEWIPPTWSSDGQRLYFQASVHGSSVLKSIDLAGQDLREVIGEGGAVGAYSLDRAQKRIAYFFGQMEDTGQVYVRELDDGRTRHLTRVNRSLLDNLELSRVEEVWFKGPSGKDLQGWIMFPPRFDPRRKYPSILEIHGGPITQYGKFFMHEFYTLAAQGYLVFFCNPRGGRGYGEEHARAIWGAWGGADYEDLMAWTDILLARPYVDGRRMGVTGGSYGGYMTVWIIGHTDRFKAAAAQRCVGNLVSEWGSSDTNWTFEHEIQAEPPYLDLKKWWEMSPMAHIKNARTPTLVIHSEGDLRCPIEQGEQVFVALKRLGVETEFLRFPEEFHGLSRTGRTDRRIVRLNAILSWMDRYLK
jgi:dipeptidyl aminopeptidase/acylaminoacyl peptidase